MDIKTQLKTAYDKDAARRDSTSKQREEWKDTIRKRFIELLREENKKTILELGSGPGIDAKFFEDEGFDILATDLSEEMIKRCKEKGLNAKVVDLYDLSSLGSTFDAIFSLNVLLHVPKADLHTILNIIYDVLNDKGIFYYGVYGGKDEETTVTDNTKMGLPRFFSFLSDESLLEAVKEKFDVISFETLDVTRNKTLSFQSLFLRKKQS